MVDSRERRERRFTSYEKIEHVGFQVVKRDQRRELYDRERVAGSIEAAMNDSGEREISSQQIGHLVMDRLRGLDPVAYVRFASVYRRFEDVDAFVKELHRLK